MDPQQDPAEPRPRFEASICTVRFAPACMACAGTVITLRPSMSTTTRLTSAVSGRSNWIDVVGLNGFG